MIFTVNSKTLGTIEIEIPVPETYEGLVEEFGVKAVHHAATMGRSLADKVRDIVRGMVASGITDIETIKAEASKTRLLPPTTRTAEEVKALLGKLALSADNDLSMALDALSQEEKDALVARLVS